MIKNNNAAPVEKSVRSASTHRAPPCGWGKGDFREALARAVRELERLEIIAKGCIEDSTKGKPPLALWLPPSV